ncbi:MAG: hypothetical protein IT281_04820 [Ignavibacteria bacterium]|nr:hypothetical protein [Ignavibacteria bacterium]MCC7158840.1 hypothetical protein [Ignavibacteria bacterium]
MSEDQENFDDDPSEDNDDENEDFDPLENFDEEADDMLSDEEIKIDDEKVRQMPIFICADNIRKLTASLIETINKEDDVLMMKEQMLLNACMLGVKIAGAEAGDFYTLRMENAVIIKIHARELLTQTSFCKLENLSKPEYLKLLRDEIEVFRKLFVEWVKSFDKSNDFKDNWGLFY